VVTSRLADWDEYFEVLQHGVFDLIASPCQPSDAIWVTLQAQHDVPTHLDPKTGSLKNWASAAHTSNTR